MVKKLLAIPKHLNINKKTTLDVQPDSQKFPHETFNTAAKGKTKPGTKCQSFCLCSQKKHLGFKKENVVDINSWKICDHCKKHHELYLNYNSENSFSLWADMMEKDLKWNKQQNLDDENQEATHNNEF